MSERLDTDVLRDAVDVRALAQHFGAVFGPGLAYAQACCPLPDHAERTPSFTVWQDTNHWYCFGCQRGGDGLRLIALFKGWTSRADFPQVADYAARFAGVSGQISAAERAAAKARVERNRKQQAERAEGERSKKIASARGRWLGAEPLNRRHAGYRYLREVRGVDLDALAKWPGAVRQGLLRWPFGEDGDQQWVEVPALMTAMQVGGQVRAVHVTALREDGSGKDVRIGQNKGRLVFGAPKGAAMCLARGRSGLPPRQAHDKHGMDDVLALTEGLEDALSVALLQPEWRVWAAYSLGNIPCVSLPDCCAEVVICADRDTTEAGRKALDQAKAKLLARAGGRAVSVAMPPEGCKDFNDVHQAMLRGQTRSVA